MLSRLLNKYRAKTFVRDDTITQKTDTHTNRYTDTQRHTDGYRHRSRFTRQPPGRVKPRLMQQTEDMGSMQERSHIWTHSWLNNSEEKCFIDFFL